MNCHSTCHRANTTPGASSLYGDRQGGVRVHVPASPSPVHHTLWPEYTSMEGKMPTLAANSGDAHLNCGKIFTCFLDLSYVDSGHLGRRTKLHPKENTSQNTTFLRVSTVTRHVGCAESCLSNQGTERVFT
eukprot:4232503-Amphidinium_carterae.1